MIRILGMIQKKRREQAFCQTYNYYYSNLAHIIEACEEFLRYYCLVPLRRID